MLQVGNRRFAVTHVPREENQDGPEWDFSDETREALLGLARGVGESLVADLEEIFSSRHCCRDFFGGKSDGPPHLLRDFLGKLILSVLDDLECFFDDLLAFGERCLGVLQEGLLSRLGELGEFGICGAIALHHRLVGGRGNRSDLFYRHGQLISCWFLLYFVRFFQEAES
jgi:hypothetical protein